MDNTTINTQNIKELYPFLTCLKWQDREIIGIVQNTSDKTISFYNIEMLATDEQRQTFLEYGDNWWNESNRLLPINIFLRDQMKMFRHCLQTYKLKEVEVVFGPVTSLNQLLKRRIKRRQIQLIVKT